MTRRLKLSGVFQQPSVFGRMLNSSSKGFIALKHLKQTQKFEPPRTGTAPDNAVGARTKTIELLPEINVSQDPRPLTGATQQV